MVNATRSPGRKTHLLALVKQGDDAFSACGFAEINAVRRPGMTAHIRERGAGPRSRTAHAVAMEQFFRIFPGHALRDSPYSPDASARAYRVSLSRSGTQNARQEN
jgi:hypothetical protein